MEELPTGGEVRVNTNPGGLTWQTVDGSNAAPATSAPDGTQTQTIQGGDPRYGMQAPILTAASVATPGGLTSSIQAARRVTLADPGDPFSPQAQVDSLVVNGRAFVSTYTAADRTFTARTPAGRSSTGRLDALGRVVEEATPGITPVQYQYDARGRLAQLIQGARQWTYAYDAQGRLASVTDPLTRSTQYFYDAGDRLNRQVLPDAREVLYGYDANGNLTAVTPPGRPAHQFAYTPVNFTSTYQPPSLGTGTWSTSYSYNLDRELTQILRPDGQVVGFAYDSAGRPSTVTVPGGALGYSYEPVTGRLGSVSGPYGGSLGFGYDGSLLTGVTWSGEVAGSVSAGYDNDFRVTSLSVNGSPVTFGYDGDGLLVQAGSLGVRRDPANGLIQADSLGGITTVRTYTAFGELASLTTARGADTLFRVTYVRDALGRISELTETVGGVTTTKAYTYGLAGRLTEVRENGTITTVYEYDANGNRLRLTTPSGTVTGTYDDQDRLLTYGTASYGYTRNGELSLKVEGSDTTHYEYDVLGNLRRVDLPDGTVIEYVVDGLNRRIGKKVNGVLVRGWLFQDQLNPIAELDGAGNVVSRFVYGSRANVPDYMIRTGVVYRIVADHLGSVRLVVNVADGSVVQRLSQEAWGVLAENTNPEFQPFGFAGGLYDEQTGLVRFGARDYDPATGRFVLTDPIGLLGADLNLFSYAWNDPVNFTDNTGAAVPILVVLVGAGALINGVFDVIEALRGCNPSLLGVIGAGLRGATAGALGTFVAVETAGALGVLGAGALGGAVGAVIEGETELGEVAFAAAAGALFGKVGQKLVPTRGRKPNLLKPRPLRDFGPESPRKNTPRRVGQEGVGGVAAGTSNILSRQAAGLNERCSCPK